MPVKETMMKIITLTDDQYEELMEDLNELNSFRYNSDLYHVDDCCCDSISNVEGNTNDPVDDVDVHPIIKRMLG